MPINDHNLFFAITLGKLTRASIIEGSKFCIGWCPKAGINEIVKFGPLFLADTDGEKCLWLLFLIVTVLNRDPAPPSFNLAFIVYFQWDLLSFISWLITFTIFFGISHPPVHSYHAIVLYHNISPLRNMKGHSMSPKCEENKYIHRKNTGQCYMFRFKCSTYIQLFFETCTRLNMNITTYNFSLYIKN